MKYRKLGRSPLAIAPLVLGGNVFGWTADRDASFAILDRFVDTGLNAIDTADIYSSWVPGHSGGESESMIGAWIASRGLRDRIVLATKVGAAPAPSDGHWPCTLSSRHIVRSVENSLRRLQTDYIDLYQAHGDDPGTPLEETLEAFDSLVRSGKVRAVGASHFEAGRLSAALDISGSEGLARFDTIQPRYNLAVRNEFEGDLQSACVERGVGALCYGALAKGFLTGKFRSAADVEGKVYAQFLRPFLNARGLRIVQALESIALGHDTHAACIAIAWVLAQPGVAAAIAAVDSVDQLDEIIGAASLELSGEDLAVLATASGERPEYDNDTA